MVSAWQATLLAWVVVNLVNLTQSAGFASRRRYGRRVNRILGWFIAGLGVPATIALAGYLRADDPWWVGPAAFDGFVILMLLVDYVRPIEFRQPRRPMILVPYLALFFGSIVLMGLPMFAYDRRLWMVTVVTSTILLGTMTVAERRYAANARATTQRRSWGGAVRPERRRSR
jgi:hypothetical protein